MKPLPYFSRPQQGVILILGFALLLWLAWRTHVLFVPDSSPPGTLHPAFVEVAGPVAHPGLYSFPKPPSLSEVWQRAGAPGAPPDKDKAIPNGSRVEITPEGGYRLARLPGAQLLVLGLPLDLNRATAQDLDAIPGIGPDLAQRIVDYRRARGPFKKIEELEEKVLGFGPQKMKDIKPYLAINE
ncbi:MAG: helix-hairpin-helix domain-containing protein [Desulfobaccales bacterium]